MKSIPSRLVSSVTASLPFTPYVLRGSLRPGDELFAIGAVVVHELSRDIIERRLAECVDPNLVSNGIVQLVFLRSMNDSSLSPSRELEKSEHVSFANVSKAADGAQVAAEVVSSRTVSAITQEVECAQPFVPALAKSGNNLQEECADVPDIEPRLALVGPEHAMQVEAMQSITKKRSASPESGAVTKKPRVEEGQQRIGHGTCYDERLDPEAWHEVFREGQWVRLKRVERNI